MTGDYNMLAMSYDPDFDDDDCDDDAAPPIPHDIITRAAATPAGTLTLEFGSQQDLLDALAASMLKLTVSENRTGHTLRDEAIETVRQEALKAAREAAKSVAPEVIRELVREQVATVIQEMVTNGFTETDQWGHAKASVTFTKRVSDILFASKDRYNNTTMVDEIARKAVTELLDRETSALIAAAKKRISAALDAKVTEKIAAAVREAIGLRV